MKKLSIIASGLLLSSTMAFAAETIDEAFKGGKVSGSLTAYGIATNTGTGSTTADSDVGYTTAGLSYVTDSYKGLTVGMSYIAGHAMADGALTNDSLMTEAYLAYATDGISLSIGRQAIDLEWLGDFNESVLASITAIPDTTITLAYTNEQTAADEDEIGNFTSVNGNEGLYVIDAKYSGVEGLELNPYFYSSKDLADYYGLKASFSTDMIGVTAQYAMSSEDTTTDDGSIGHIELSGSFEGLSVAAGYIKTDKDVGTGSIEDFGDNISPFDNGANTYAADAKTVYGSIGYSIAGLDLGVLYGTTDFGANSEESELNVSAGYSFTESLSLGLLYVDYDLDGSTADDFDSISATLAYSF